MREIKFRAWDKEDEVMIDWFWLSSEGDLYETPVTVYDTPHLELERNDDLIAMQYTGLKDKNGKEIYEGDILHWDSHWDWYVGFENGSFRRIPTNDIQRMNWKHHRLQQEDFETWEVIGNIYESPELIGGNQ